MGAMLFVSGSRALAQGAFVHPGLMHSEQDFERIREGLKNNDPQVVEAYAVLRNCWTANKAVTDVWAINDWIKRGIAGDENYMNCYRNAAKAYQCALLWKITGEKEWADRVIYILDNYVNITVGLTGNTNQSLIPAFIGYQFANAAELMRDCEYWPKESFERFKQWMIDVWFVTAQDFLERRHDTVVREGNWYHYHSNWGVGNALFCVSLGVLCDLPDIYNYGMYWLKEGPGNESLLMGPGMCNDGWGLVPWCHEDARGPLGYLNQMQESGRDQGHAMAALGLVSYWMQTAYNQGDNAFCNVNDHMIAGAAEYVAMFNSLDNNIPSEAEEIASIPYKQNWWMGALNWTGQGQHRPIWQLFINHYENRMGVPMPYCKRMHAKLGIESGGNNVYGTNSGGWDHTGYGDLLHHDSPVRAHNRPTVLRPQITNGTTVRPYAEIYNVAKGTELELTALLPDTVENTGNWVWEDGVTGQSRTITADTSGLWRVTYTNHLGVKSTQMFCISVYGEGIRATLKPWITYDGVTVEDTVVYAVAGKAVTLGTTYANWNYIKSEKWYSAAGKELASGGSYTFTQSSEDKDFVFQLTNESGVVIEKRFHVINSVLTPELKVNGVVQDGTSALVPAGSDIVLKGVATSLRYRNGDFLWSSGETTDSLVFDNVQWSFDRTLDWSKLIYKAQFNFNVQVYNNDRVLADGYYHFKDKNTGKYFSNQTLKFEDMPDDADSASYVWHLTWDDKALRYKIQNHDDTKFLDSNGTFDTKTYLYRRSSYNIFVLTGQNDCIISNAEASGGYYWKVVDDILVCNLDTDMPASFPFELVPLAGDTDGVEDVTAQAAALDVQAASGAIRIQTSVPVRAYVYNLSGRMLKSEALGIGEHELATASLPRGVYVVRVTDGTQTQVVKFMK